MSYLEALNKRIPSYPSIIPREFNFIRALEHIPDIMPKAKIVGATAIASSSEEMKRRTVKTGTDIVSTVNRNMFKPDIEEPGTDSPLDIAITGKELVEQATEHNPDVNTWTVKSLALVTKPLISHENFDTLDSIVRTLNAHKTLGRSAGFTGVMNPYYETRHLLQQMGLWSKKVRASYRPRSVLKTHKIIGKTDERFNIGYDTLFSETSIAQKYFTEATRKNSRLLDVGIPEPIINQTNGEQLLGETGAIVFALMKNSQRIAAVLGPDIPIYTFSRE
ncbi:MAG TPA: hypothetical protein VMW50_03290 [Dehalococcoidia bacterium]|nr:hypothetical protein [Dehalococcoidia bacterium]